MKEYKDYGEYLEDAYEEWAERYEKKRISVQRTISRSGRKGRPVDNGNQEI